MNIFYLIDLEDRKLVAPYEGVDDVPPAEASAHAKERAEATGHVHALARGMLFFQKGINFPETPPPEPKGVRGRQ